MRELTLGSLFDGSGGFPLAAALEGIRPVWASEVEPYPIAVTRSRFPNMKHEGDVSQLNGATLEPVDIITFGSPCQDLSVAGKRAGLKHEAVGDEETTRSGLFLEAIRIIKEMREATHGVYPTFAIWENVTGAFSSSKGEDFRTVLNEFVQIVELGAEVPPPPQGKWAYADILMGDGFSIAYRTFDAQYWGAPQRRRRIYLVADFRGERAGEILFKRKGLRGYPSPRTEAREGTAAGPKDGSGTADSESVGLYEPRSMKEENWTRQAVKGALRAEASKSAHVLIENHPTVYDAESVRGVGINGVQGFGETGPGFWRGGIQTLRAEDVCFTLNTVDRHAVAICTDIKFFYSYENKGTTLLSTQYKDPPLVCYWDGGQIAGTLTVSNADGSQRMPDTGQMNCELEQKQYAPIVGGLNARDYKGVGAQYVEENKLVVEENKTEQRYIVRRLTPLECCRLQGFPDGWGEIDPKEDFTGEEFEFWLDVRNTHGQINGKAIRHYTKAQMLTWYNKLHTDSAEYKMWGNGVALPCVRYVMQGIADAVKIKYKDFKEEEK